MKKIQRKLFLNLIVVIGTFLFILPCSGESGRERIICIETHNHLFARTGPAPSDIDFDGDLRSALSKMESFGIKKMFILPPPFPMNHPAKEEVNDFIPYLKKYRDRFGTVGGGGTLNVMIQEAVYPFFLQNSLSKSVMKML